MIRPWPEDVNRETGARARRSLNTVRNEAGDRTYSYARYSFSNRSADIKRIFCEHLDLLEVEWRRMNRWTISVARREAVAKLDAFVGPKR